MSVAVSLTAPQFSTSFEPVLDAARAVETLGFHGIFLFDHLVPLGDPTRPVLELAGSLGAVAAVTSSVKVGSLVMRAPLRGPEVSCGIARTVAAIAPGRVVVGLGAGDSLSNEEARRFGTPLASLDRRLSELSEAVAASAGIGVERWVGGLHPAILEIAERADGWNGWAIDADRLRELSAQLRVARPELTVSWGGSVVMGADDEDLDDVLRERDGRGGTITGTPSIVLSELRRLVDAGADHLVLSVLPNQRDRWELFAERVLGKVGGKRPGDR